MDSGEKNLEEVYYFFKDVWISKKNLSALEKIVIVSIVYLAILGISIFEFYLVHDLQLQTKCKILSQFYNDFITSCCTLQNIFLNTILVHLYKNYLNLQ